jgi:hypothetical protein
MFSPYAWVCTLTLKGLACRAHVNLASSHEQTARAQRQPFIMGFMIRIKVIAVVVIAVI